MKKTDQLLHKTNIENKLLDFYGGLTFSVFGSEPKSTNYVRNEPMYYSIQFNYSGTFQLQIDDGKMFELNGPYAFLTYPGHFFRYGPPDNMTRHHNYICTYGPRIQRYMDGGLWNPDTLLPMVRIPHPERFLRSMQEIMTLAGQPGPVNPRAVLLFEDLLLQMHEAKKDEKRHTPHQAEQLKELVQRIGANPEYEWNFAEEAQKCHVTLTHFRRIFKEITDMSPQQFLLQMRLNRAAELLKASTAPIKEIAAMAGWDNVFYFSRMFRKKYYISPLQYRREFLN